MSQKASEPPFLFRLNKEFFLILIVGGLALFLGAIGVCVRQVFFGTPQRGALTLGTLVLCVLWWHSVTYT